MMGEPSRTCWLIRPRTGTGGGRLRGAHLSHRPVQRDRNPAVPALEISGNPLEVRTMDAHMNVGVPGVLSRETTISEAGDALVDMVVRTANV